MLCPARDCCALRLRSAQLKPALLPALSLRGAKRRGNPYSHFAGFSADRSKCSARQGPAVGTRMILRCCERARCPAGTCGRHTYGSPALRASALPGKKCCALRCFSDLLEQDGSIPKTRAKRFFYSHIADYAKVKKRERKSFFFPHSRFRESKKAAKNGGLFLNVF